MLPNDAYGSHFESVNRFLLAVKDFPAVGNFFYYETEGYPAEALFSVYLSADANATELDVSLRRWEQKFGNARCNFYLCHPSLIRAGFIMQQPESAASDFCRKYSLLYSLEELQIYRELSPQTQLQIAVHNILLKPLLCNDSPPLIQPTAHPRNLIDPLCLKHTIAVSSGPFASVLAC